MCSKRDLGKLSQMTLMCVSVSGEREREKEKKNLHFVISRLTCLKSTTITHRHLLHDHVQRADYSAASIVTKVCCAFESWIPDDTKNDSAN